MGGGPDVFSGTWRQIAAKRRLPLWNGPRPRPVPSREQRFGPMGTKSTSPRRGGIPPHELRARSSGGDGRARLFSCHDPRPARVPRRPRGEGRGRSRCRESVALAEEGSAALGAGDSRRARRVRIVPPGSGRAGSGGHSPLAPSPGTAVAGEAELPGRQTPDRSLRIGPSGRTGPARARRRSPGRSPGRSRRDERTGAGSPRDDRPPDAPSAGRSRRR